MTSVLVTGITGFIGSSLASELVRRGYRVYGVVRHCASRELGPLKGLLADITLLTADITSQQSITAAMKSADPDLMVHLAALTPVRYSFEHSYSYADANYLGTMNVVHALMELPDYKARRLVVASTGEVYGVQETRRPFTEGLPLRPSSPYAVSKAAAEMYVRMATKVYGLNGTVLRPTNTIGRVLESGFIAEYLAFTMLRDEKVYVGAPESVRDYIFVDDHVSAYLLAIEKGLEPGEAYNVGRGSGVTNKELARRLARLTGYDFSKVVLGSYPPGYPFRPTSSDQPYLVLNTVRARAKGWRPRVGLEDGLKRLVTQCRAKLDADGIRRDRH